MYSFFYVLSISSGGWVIVKLIWFILFRDGTNDGGLIFHNELFIVWWLLTGGSSWLLNGSWFPGSAAHLEHFNRTLRTTLLNHATALDHLNDMSCICWPATGSVLKYIFLKPKSKLINYVWTFCKVWIRLLGGFITFNNYMFSLLQP